MSTLECKSYVIDHKREGGNIYYLTTLICIFRFTSGIYIADRIQNSRYKFLVFHSRSVDIYI